MSRSLLRPDRKGTYVRFGMAAEMRECRRCGGRKPLSEFHRWHDDHQWWCKPCRAEYAAAHYQRHKKRRQAQNKRRQAEFFAWYTSLKAGKPCADCGLVFHPVAMHWHHLPGRKKTSDLGRLVKRGNRQQVLDEIAKCELICANCHAVRTFVSGIRGAGRDAA
jgi:hypothetical protein